MASIRDILEAQKEAQREALRRKAGNTNTPKAPNNGYQGPNMTELLNRVNQYMNYADRMDQFERSHGTIDQGKTTFNPSDESQLRNSRLDGIARRGATISHELNRAISRIGQYTEQLRRGFSQGTFQRRAGNPNDRSLNAQGLERLSRRYRQAQRILSNPMIRQTQNRTTSQNGNTRIQTHYSLNPNVSRNMNSAQQQASTTHVLGTNNRPRPSSYIQSLKSAGVTPIMLSTFAARALQQQQGQPVSRDPREALQVFRNSTSAGLAGGNFLRNVRQRARNALSYNGNMNRIRHMAQRQIGTSITDKNYRYIHSRANTAFGGNGQTDPYKVRWNQDHSHVENVQWQGGSNKGPVELERERLQGLHDQMKNLDQTDILDSMRNNLRTLHENGINTHVSNSDSAKNTDNGDFYGGSYEERNQAQNDIENASNDPNASATVRNAARGYLDNARGLRAFNHTLQEVNDTLDNLNQHIGNTTGTVDKLDSSLTSNTAQGANDPNKTLFKYEPGSLQSMAQKMMSTAFYAKIANSAFGGLRQTGNNGASLRMAEEPGINSQVLGEAINGNPQGYHADNYLTNRLNQAGWRYGQTPEEMSQYLGALSGTRATGSGVTNGAINLAHFARDNNVAPQATAQLFNTLGQSGGLGSTSGQVQNNTLDLSRQFAGMLQQNHLGAMGTQQAQGLNSIYSNMLGSGQTVTPNSAGNVMAMQSVLSHGPGGQVFQGQQGAQQLNAFSQGVGGAFNNMLIRNAFAGGMSQYGGQQGLYRLQMDMQEPLKHPTQLNNMIQGMANTGLGPSGTEDALTQMGLGPEAAKKVYRDAMSGRLTQSNLDRIKQRDRGTGRNTQRRSHAQYEQEGTSSLDKIKAIDQNISERVNMIYDALRNARAGFEGPQSTNGFGSSALSMIGGIGSNLASDLPLAFLDLMGGGKGGSIFHPIRSARNTLKGGSRLFRPRTWRALGRGFKNGTGISGRLRGARDAYKSAYGIGKGTENTARTVSRASNVAKMSRIARNGERGTLAARRIGRVTRYIPRMFGPAARNIGRVAQRMPRVGRYATAVGRGIARHPGVMRVGHLTGRALDAIAPAAGLWTAGHYARRGHLIRAVSGGLDAGLSNSTIGLVGSLGSGAIRHSANMLHLNGPARRMSNWFARTLNATGNHPLHSIGEMLGFDNSHTAHAASIHGRHRPDYSRRRRSSSENSSHRQTRHSIFYWLYHINRLLPALAKKMEGFSDVDPSLVGSKGTNGGIGGNGSNSNNSSSNGSTSSQPASATDSSVSKNLNRTGTDTSPTQSAAPFMANVTPEYVGARYHNNNNNTNDDHSTHDSHNVYNNYIKAPSQNYLQQLANNSQNTADYFSRTHKTNWA